MASYSPEEYFHKVDNMILISFQVLRKLFQKRWKKETGKDWENTEEQGKAFCENEGKHILKLTNDKFLKEKLLNGCLENWDMTTLSVVIRNFGDRSTYKVENDTVEALKGMRNKLSHHGSKKFSMTEYNEKVELFRTYLLAIHVDQTEIDKIIEKAGNTSSSAALEATKRLYEQAEEYIKKQNFVKALKYFDETTTMHSLLPEHQGVAYEKRSECHLKLVDIKRQNQSNDEAEKCIAQAMLDATTALELNDSSWNAHYLIAKCHRLQKSLGPAIQHFQKALAICPTQNHVKEDLHSCKRLLGLYKREDNVDPRYMPVNLTERIAHLEAETGRKQTEQEFLHERTSIHGKIIKGQDDVFRGHQHIMGWNVQQSDVEAFRYYEKAANVGNAEGIYNVGLCYSRAKGVAQDLSKAYNLYLRAANMSPSTPGISSSAGNKNIGVAAAQHSLGIMYQEGVYVEQDYSQAVEWYTKATENGCGSAANNLAVMYINGLGVPKDEKKAEMYWNQAVIFKDHNAASSLVNHYVYQMEPEKARAMYRTGKLLGNTGLSSLTEQEFDDWLDSTLTGDLDRRKYEDEVIAYEKEKSLDSKGMTFWERLQRYIFTKDKKVEELTNSFKEIESNEGWGGRISGRGWDKSRIDRMTKLAYQGSSAAERVLRAMFISVQLGDFMKDKEVFNEQDKTFILNLLYEYLTLNLSTGTGMLISQDGRMTLKRVIGQLFDSKCDGRQSEEEMKIRFCYVIFNKMFSLQHGDTYMEELLQQGIRMYPDNMYYYDLLSSLYANRGAWKSALEWAEKGLSKFPDHLDLLYSKAVHIRQLPEEDGAELCLDTRHHESSRIHKLLDKGKRMKEEKKKAIPAYKEFINKAPNDHRKLPEAYYSLAHFYIQDVMPHRKTKPEKLTALPSYKKLEHYYKMGKEAEGNMLPCYLPYGESDTKKWVELTLNLVKENAGNTPLSPSSPRPSPSNSNTMSSSGVSNFDSSRSSSVTSKPQPVRSGDILETKQYLTNPIRKDLILRHREKMSAYNEVRKRSPDLVYAGHTQAPTLRQTAPTRMSRVKPITLKDMNPTSDHIYKDRILDLTIIEDPSFGAPSVHLVAEDDNGDVTRLYIYNVEQNRETAKQLGHGATIAILNPYMRIGSQDTTNGIRNDEPSCLIYLEGLEKMCRFCGVENAQHKCSKCKKASYCSRECQKHDFKIMKHNFICWE